MPDTKDLIETEAVKAVALERSLIEATQAIRTLQQQVDEAWAIVKEAAVEAYKKGDIEKTTKRDWGSITITECTDFKIDEQKLPSKFWKKVVDTTKIRDTYNLEGKAPKGIEPVLRLGFMKKIKEAD